MPDEQGRTELVIFNLSDGTLSGTYSYTKQNKAMYKIQITCGFLITILHSSLLKYEANNYTHLQKSNYNRQQKGPRMRS